MDIFTIADWCLCFGYDTPKQKTTSSRGNRESHRPNNPDEKYDEHFEKILADYRRRHYEKSDD